MLGGRPKKIGVVSRPVLRAPQHTAARLLVRTQQNSIDDAYAMLGLTPGADAEQVEKAYKRRVFDARGNKDQEKLQQLDSAHGMILMQQFKARAAGGVDRTVAYADRAQLFPWRPKQYSMPRNFIIGMGIIQGLLLLWGTISFRSAHTQPVIYSAGIAMVAGLYKQNQVYPPAGGPGATEQERGQGFKNIIRSFFLALLGTLLGMFVMYTFPDLLASALGRVMNDRFYELQTALITVGATVANFVMTSFYR